jgi:DNA polymerase gamma 1
MTENLFLVMTSPKKEKIGSELRSRITAPNNYNIVSADFSSQELVIASMYGDSKNFGGELGSCPMTYNTLLGTKEDFSDIHSSTTYNLFLKPKGYIFKEGQWYIHEKD